MKDELKKAYTAQITDSKTDEPVSIGASELARLLYKNPGFMLEVMSDYFNIMGNGQRTGQMIGKAFQYEHRTLQGVAVNWFIGFLVGIQEGVNPLYGTDPRNEQAIKLAQKVASIAEAEGYQFFI